jgi:hypothetical protein
MSKIIDFARKQIGKPYVFGTSGPDSFDCSGLTKRASKQIGLDLYHGASTQYHRGIQEGRTDQYGYWGATGEIDSLPMDKVAFLFAQDKERPGVMAHTGLYEGNNYVTQAGGYGGKGVHRDKIDKRRWTHWGTLNAYWTERDESMVLVKGAEGESVKAFQEKLILLGHDLGKWGADGKFGNATESAVKAFQADHALPVNGAWGEAEEVMAEDLLSIINEPEPIEKLVIFKQADWDEYLVALEKLLTKAT